MYQMAREFRVIAEDAFLWIYSSKTGQLKKFDKVSIQQFVNRFTHKPVDDYNAVNKQGVDRLVNGMEWGIWFYPRFQEYLVWGKTDNDNRAKQIIMKTINQRSREHIKECLDTLKKDHTVLELANANLLGNNFIISIKPFSEVKNVINKYFFGL
jgi:hypothetical protein